MRYAVRLAVVICAAFASLVTASAENRVALVIGNADYKIGRLANPVNDAEAVAEAFKSQLTFDTVILRKDLKRDGFVEALREMARASAGAQLAVVFFAGHGIEIGGRNYLVPIDAALATPADIEFEAIALDTVLRQLDGVTKLRLVILDACRNNPFPAAKRSSTRGLSRVEPDGGALVAYAAKDGTTADDGKAGRHSPFTAALLKRIVIPGLDVRLMFGYVSDDVKVATNQAQVPHLYGQLGGEQMHLVPAVVTDAKPVVAPTPPSEAAETARICREVAGISSLATLTVLERQHKGHPAGECVTARIEEVKRQQTASVAPPKPASQLETTTKGKALSPKRGATPLTTAEELALKPKDSFKECAECPEMVVVPSGSFTMGSSQAEIAALNEASEIQSLLELPRQKVSWYDNEGPQRRVTIARPFAVGKYEITFAEWDACVAEGGCSYSPHDGYSSGSPGWGRGKRPVINVSWDDITKDYLPWLSRKTGKMYRLLTEAEWEYAARAGTTTRYAFGDTISKNQAQYDATKTVEVGSFQPNAFGIYDMHGNVSERVQDCWNGNSNGAPLVAPLDGTAWTIGNCSDRVVRGGAWNGIPRFLRSAFRSRYPTISSLYRISDVGFRVARTL